MHQAITRLAWTIIISIHILGLNLGWFADTAHLLEKIILLSILAILSCMPYDTNNSK
jgi:hypothetical protein